MASPLGLLQAFCCTNQTRPSSNVRKIAYVINGRSGSGGLTVGVFGKTNSDLGNWSKGTWPDSYDDNDEPAFDLQPGGIRSTWEIIGAEEGEAFQNENTLTTTFLESPEDR